MLAEALRESLFVACLRDPGVRAGSRWTLGRLLSFDGDFAPRELEMIRQRSRIRHQKFSVRRWAWLLPLTFLGGVGFADDLSERDAAQTSTNDIAEVVVVGMSPVQGAGVPLDVAPSNVQTLSARQIEENHAQTLTDLLDREFSSLALSDTEGSPFQKDFSFRGFTASPVLGTPAGIAVYQNGVRVNEPFGDTVLWDFIPVFALEKLQLIPGSNPVFGLNALGGAVTFQMKDGFYDSGTSVDLSGGSFGREKGVLEYGARWGDFAFYTGALVSHETDWRQYSESTLVQSFSDLALKERTYSLGLSLTLAGSSLNGNGASPADELSINRSAIFAIPDTEHNRLVFLQGRGEAALSGTVSLQGVAYYRHSRQTTYNGEYSGFESCDDDAAILCNDDGPISTESGGSIPASIGGTAITAVQVTSSNEFGFSVQTSFSSPLWGHANSAVMGLSFDTAMSNFNNQTQLGNVVLLSPSGFTTTPLGYTLGSSDYNTRLDATTRYYGLYGTDTYEVADKLHATVSWRLNRAEQVLTDRFGDSLNGRNTYVRLNPSAGITWQARDSLNLFASYSESNRIPTPAELSCANPIKPCLFPLSFISDPPLKQVIARTVEVGARGRLANAIAWSVAAYGTRNANDILFAASGPQIGSGYFTNAGATQRVGVEASITGSWEGFEFHANYGFVNATFRSRLEIQSPNNPAADDNGNIFVIPGDRLPGIPQQTAKFSVDYHLTPAWIVGSEVIFESSKYLRGDEANLQRPLAGYTTLDVRTSYDITRRIAFYAEAENVLDKHYATFGLYGDPTGGGAFPQFSDPRFYTPAAPFGIWAGIKVRL
jgi:iron complex outermembrane receptor protein